MLYSVFISSHFIWYALFFKAVFYDVKFFISHCCNGVFEILVAVETCYLVIQITSSGT